MILDAGLPGNEDWRMDLRVFALAVGNFVTASSAFVLVGLLNEIAADLHVSVAVAGLLAAGFAGTSAVLAPVVGILGSRIARRTLLVGVAVKGKNVVPDPKPIRPSPEVEALYAVRFLRGLIGNDSAQRKSNLTMLAVALAMGALEGKRLK